MTAARQRVRGAAQHGTARAGDASRHTGEMARERTRRAARALRGEQPPSRWRWLAGGFAAGGALVAAGATALIRARHSATPTGGATPEQPSTARKAADAVVAAATQPVPTARKAANAAATAVRDGTSTAAHHAADGARHTAARAREAIRGNHDHHPGDQPGADRAAPSEPLATNRATPGKAGTVR